MRTKIGFPARVGLPGCELLITKNIPDMKANYYFQINEGFRAITLAPCNAFQAVRLYNYFADGLSLLKEVSGVTCIELYRVGESLPKRILI